MKSGRGFALRFLAYGQRRYVTLGTEHDGWTRRKAGDELQNVLADVRRGIWIPPDRTRTASVSNGPRDVDNLRKRVLAPAVERADRLLKQRDQAPLPEGVTPHKLRHTFASIFVACGEDPASLMAQLGHTDPKFTLRVYTHLMRRNPVERAQLKALVNCEPAAPREATAFAGGDLLAA